MDSELLECASNLGFSESGIYYPGETCAESLNDLWSFLKRTDQTVERYISFYRSKIITDDIIPLICSQPEDDEIMFAQFQLLFLLTFPISRILIDEEINKEKFNMYLELMNLQLNMREEISNTEIFSAFKYYLKTFLQTSQDKNEYIEIILNIIINLFNEENSTRVCCSKNYSLIYEKLMRNFFTSHLSSIILFLTNSQGQILSSYYALAILFNVLKYINAGDITLIDGQKNNLLKSLEVLVKQEDNKTSIKNSNKRIRHSGFGGTIIKTLDDTNQMIIVNPKSSRYLNCEKYSDINESNIQDGKQMRKKSKKQQLNQNINKFRILPIDLKLLVDEFCKDFLLYSFNIFIEKIRNFKYDSDVCNSGDHFVWCLWFFLKINRTCSYYRKF
ncbi:hypothetical protein HZS_5352 [Henneguya salminicola]|nr:hypothetical protein HZS_5352 [Henneguya salminicola]